MNIEMPKKGFRITFIAANERSLVEDYIRQVNQSAKKHTKCFSDILDAAEEAERRLDAAGVAKVRRVGCTAFYSSGIEHVAKACSFGFAVNNFELVRTAEGWNLTSFQKLRASRQDKTSLIVYLPAQDFERMKAAAVKKVTDALQPLPIKIRGQIQVVAGSERHCFSLTQKGLRAAIERLNKCIDLPTTVYFLFEHANVDFPLSQSDIGFLRTKPVAYFSPKICRSLLLLIKDRARKQMKKADA